MPRIPRAVAATYPHHIDQRGNYRQDVFTEEIDYINYLRWLGEYSSKYHLKIWAYCLMSNHVHFLCVPEETESLARTLNSLHSKYALYFNQKRNLKGHLWQGRFSSCILDKPHVLALTRYIENHPVRAQLVRMPQDYPWSSAWSHVFKEANPLLDDGFYLVKEIDDWLAFLMEKDDKAIINNIITNMKTGRPCGDHKFAKKIERLLNRRLEPLPRGRPRKLRQS